MELEAAELRGELGVTIPFVRAVDKAKDVNDLDKNDQKRRNDTLKPMMVELPHVPSREVPGVNG